MLSFLLLCSVLVLHNYNHNYINHNGADTNACTGKYNTKVDSVVQVQMHLLTSWLQFIDTRRETQFLKVFRNHTMLTPLPTFGKHILWCLRSQFISASRDPKNSTLWLNGPISTSQLTLFQNPQILRTISSGHDVIHTPAHFQSGVLLWQWWLSYPLRMSVKLYLMTTHLNS